jgi:hypothetical protein
MNKRLIALAVAILVATVALAQKQAKPWNEWTKKEAERVFDDSPWSRTQTESESSQSSDVTTNFGDTRGREEAVRSGTNASVKFHVRFFSARPIRQAYARMLQMGETVPDPAAIEKMNAWANLQADDRIIVAVSFDGDQRYVGRVAKTFRGATTADIKNNIYLERKDGKRVFLSDYVPPSKDPFGARFVFPRTVDGQPFVTANGGTLRFHAEYDPKIPEASATTGQTGSRSGGSRTESPYKIKLDVKFKLAEMIQGGELEY